jgi:hypothetical protein
MKISEGMNERFSSLKAFAYRNEVRVRRATIKVVAPARSRTRDAWISLL